MLPDTDFKSQSVQIYGCVFHDTHGQNLGQTLKIQWFFSTETCTDTHSLVSCGEDSSTTFCWSLDVKKYRIGNVFLFIGNKGYFSSVNVDGIKTAGKKQNMAPMWKKLTKLVDLDEPALFLDHVNLVCTRRECETRDFTRDFLLKSYRKCSNHKFLRNYQSRKDGCVVLRHGRACSNMR